MVYRLYRRRSFSYVEALIALLVLSLGLTTGINLYGVQARQVLADERSVLAGQLAAELMTEVFSRAFEDAAGSPGTFGRGSGEVDRTDFDDVDDYDGWTENPAAYRSGTSLTERLANCTRAVVVENVDPTNLSSVQTDGSTAAKRITVAATCDGRVVARLVAFRTRNAALP